MLVLLIPTYFTVHRSRLRRRQFVLLLVQGRRGRVAMRASSNSFVRLLYVQRLSRANGFRSYPVSVVSRLIGQRSAPARDWFVPARERLPSALIYTAPDWVTR